MNFGLTIPAGIFRTGLPFQLALCVRGMRNSRAHQAYAAAVTEDERLFDLHSLRRFTMLVDNRAVKPGLAAEFHAALDARILDATQRCLGGEVPNTVDTASPSPPAELGALLELSVQTHQDLAAVQGQLQEVAERLADVSAASGLTPAAAFVLPVDSKVDERLGTIEWKLDQLLARAEARPPATTEAAEDTGLPERLSYLEAKAALRTLRARLADKFPETEPVRQLLRQSMVDLFLEHRIADTATYEARVPEVMRRDTDKRQLEALPQIFDIIERLRQ